MNGQVKACCLGFMSLILLGAATNVCAKSTTAQAVQAAIEASWKENQPAAFEVYKSTMAQLTKPEPSAILQAVHALAVGTMWSAGNSPFMSVEVATELNTPVTVGWNDYRPYTLMEVLGFLPENHGVLLVADFEFQFKTALLPRQVKVDTVRCSFAASLSFTQAYSQFKRGLREATHKMDRQVVEELAMLGAAYQEVYQDTPELAVQFYKSIFRNPLRTGWDRTVTVEQLLRDLGKIERGGGDYYETRSEQDLMKTYGISQEEAKNLVFFVEHLYL